MEMETFARKNRLNKQKVSNHLEPLRSPEQPRKSVGKCHPICEAAPEIAGERTLDPRLSALPASGQSRKTGEPRRHGKAGACRGGPPKDKQKIYPRKPMPPQGLPKKGTAFIPKNPASNNPPR